MSASEINDNQLIELIINNANIANFILAVPLEKNLTNEVYNLEM